MADIEEKPESRPLTVDILGRPVSGELLFTVWGTEDENEANLAALGWLPAFFQGLLFQDYRLEKTEGPVWDGTANYSRSTRPRQVSPADQPGGPSSGVSGLPPGEFSSFDDRLSISFDTSGDTIRITQAIETTPYGLSEGEPPPATGRAIGVTDQGVEGIDINQGGFDWTETHILPAAAITKEYLDTLKRLTWKTNAAPFRAMAVGEVLFKGAQGTGRTGSPAEISFSFSARENREMVDVGGGIIVDEIGGHEYLEVRYKDSKDDVGGFQIKVPEAAYVHKIYFAEEFNFLEIGE